MKACGNKGKQERGFSSIRSSLRIDSFFTDQHVIEHEGARKITQDTNITVAVGNVLSLQNESGLSPSFQIVDERRPEG